MIAAGVSLLLLLFALAIVFAWRKWDAQDTLRMRQWREQEQKQRVKYVQKLDEELAEWLLTLELPQFAEQTRREEAARQLGIVLIERLMLRQYPDRPSTNHPPS